MYHGGNAGESTKVPKKSHDRPIPPHPSFAMIPDPAALPDREVFVGWVHDALTHLYDTHFLNKHPLAGLLAGMPPSGALSDTTQRSQALRRLLVDAIRALRPAPGTPAQSPDWRGHHILEMRYIEGLTPVETMERLALSKSHYFREQARVVDAVADLLWAQVVARPSPASAASRERMKACACCAISGEALRPVPMAQTGS